MRSVLGENLGAISKHPEAWVRLRRRDHELVTPLNPADKSFSPPSEIDSTERASSSHEPRHGDLPGESQGNRSFPEVTTQHGQAKRGTSLAKYTARSEKEKKLAQVSTMADVSYPVFCPHLITACAEWEFNCVMEAQCRDTPVPLQWKSLKVSAWEDSQVDRLYHTNAAEKIVEKSETDSCIAQAEEFIGVDLSRLPPSRYLVSKAGIQAIKKEVTGLSAGRPGRVTPLSIIDRHSPDFTPATIVPMTLVVRLKNNNQVKARLCLRGDCMRPMQRHFMSAPTADRCLARILLSCASTRNFRVMMCDISQAFSQADVIPEQERFYAFPPPCIPLSST